MTAPRLLVTGSRDWIDAPTLEHASDWAAGTVLRCDRLTLVHGAAPGADTLADAWARRNEHDVDDHPASRYGHPLTRNTAMVALGADLCLAFVMPGARGTWHCAVAANAAGIPVRIVTAPAVTDQLAAARRTGREVLAKGKAMTDRDRELAAVLLNVSTAHLGLFGGAL